MMPHSISHLSCKSCDVRVKLKRFNVGRWWRNMAASLGKHKCLFLANVNTVFFCEWLYLTKTYTCMFFSISCLWIPWSIEHLAVKKTSSQPIAKIPQHKARECRWMNSTAGSFGHSCPLKWKAETASKRNFGPDYCFCHKTWQEY